ncbi:putative biosynthetic protein (TIGR04098 family) [Allocatelliglobosispora scoriae]|uniref:Putative biosynthetic protein (TIGR04098 family) n=1 Tax=Allocatelliglobosispora scoriae TaxID=643052 RepID=A0A841BP37_9ACTN|nr:LnmK family bifunctional acyltransferase/decarboxylase [Allocatelliglobosispora scoriae]MBB5868502.1 putative biosynthetic protein (TIGR04098 family) [Allocatelliglobosispora scoriae]
MTADALPTVSRTVRVTPSMCGDNNMFYARVGDWTWETVADLCAVDVLRAQGPDGRPTYLSFFYYRVRGSRLANVQVLAFGDVLDVASTSFGFGSEAVLTLHRIAVNPAGEPAALTLREFYEAPDPGCLYVETMNRWVSRAGADSNEGLVLSSPPDFRYTQLPLLPRRHSPQAACTAARKDCSFHANSLAGYDLVLPDIHQVRPVDITRDINGAGLVYFASFFAYLDGAVLAAWSEIGRRPSDYQRRRVLDTRLCYFGNLDHHQSIHIAARLWRSQVQPERETVEVVLREAETMRLLAVASVDILVPTQPAALPPRPAGDPHGCG